MDISVAKEDIAVAPVAFNTTAANAPLHIPSEENNFSEAKRNDEKISEEAKSLLLTQEPKITIQEIIPEIKEIPMTEAPKAEPTAKIQNEKPQHLEILTAEEPENRTEVREENDVITFDVDSDSSEISEIYHQPPPVLRIGDKLLFLKKGELVPEKDTSTPASVITIIGAEGLQRGFEDSSEMHETSVKPSRDENSDSKPQESTHILSLVKQKTTTTDANTDSSTTESIKVIPLETTTSSKVVESKEATIVPDYNETTTKKTSDASDATTVVPEAENSTTNDEENTTVALEITTEEIEIKTESLENDTLVNSAENLTTEVNVLEVSSAAPEPITEEIIVLEENPAYPPIPEIMTPEVPDEIPERIDQETLKINKSKENTEDSKILPDVLEIRNNYTIPQNVSHNDWLKNESSKNSTAETLVNLKAALPEDILNQAVASDFEDSAAEADTEPVTETSTTDTNAETSTGQEFGSILNRDILAENQVLLLADEPETISPDMFGLSENDTSKEQLELSSSVESGESTTKRNNPVSLMSSEDASVDVIENNSPEETMAEQVEIILPLKESKEETDDDDKGVELKDVPKGTTQPKNSAEVEMFDPESIAKAPERIQEAPKAPEKLTDEPKAVEKRENSVHDQIFQELDDELNAAKTERVQTKKSETKEAEQIFKELLEEVNTTPQTKETLPAQSRNKETEVLQRVSDAIAKFQLRDTKQSLDTNILGILRDFFSSQYRSYEG